MFYKVFIYSFLFYSTFANHVMAQGDCKELLQTCADSLAAISEPIKGKAYFLHIRAYNDVKPGDFKIPGEITSKLFMTKNTYVIEMSGGNSMYYDTANVAIVMHGQNTIMIHDIRKFPDARQRQVMYAQVQKSFIEGSDIVQCKDTAMGGTLFKFIKLEPNNDVQQQYSIKDVEYIIGPQSGKLKQVKINYSRQHKQFYSQTLEYLAFDLDYKAFREKPASEYIFDKTGKVQNRYAKYKIIDNRGK